MGYQEEAPRLLARQLCLRMVALKEDESGGTTGGFHGHGGTPIAGCLCCFIMEKAIKIDDFGVALFEEMAKYLV